MLQFEFPISYWENPKGGFNAAILNYRAYGHTLEEAKENVIQAMEAGFEVNKQASQNLNINNCIVEEFVIDAIFTIADDTIGVTKKTKDRVDKVPELKKYFQNFFKNNKK
jgi:hypothetical protein